jgi:UDP-N-acetylglucosamine--N-acetylmuramyl-(pentapeptide) pyrophosphoryl-undecaprenol N-acetylglucosamine transferase
MTIVLTAGGTGGHVFPALSLAKKLDELGYVVDLFIDRRGLKYHGSIGIHQVKCLPIWRIKGVLSYPLLLLSLGVSVLYCLCYFLRHRPQLVVGFGGYVSAPAMIAAYLLRIKTLLHEQNAVLGRVNRRLAKYATRLATSFPEVKYAEGLPVICTGNPVRDAFLKVREQPYPKLTHKLRILVVGGSQGAAIFSRVIPRALALLSPGDQEKIELIQQCRPELFHQTKTFYQNMNFKVFLKEFFADIDQQIEQAHLVICRAGAMTVSELAVAGRPAIFVPYAQAMDNHQFYNAKQLVNRGGGWLFKEKEFSPSLLAHLLKEILEDPLQLKEKVSKIRAFAIPQAVTNLAKLVQDLLPKS